MSAKRGTSGLCGVLPVDKPAGLTSHDVVNRIRRATGERRVGHAGTLDPMATGLLVVLVGPATRLEPYLSAAEKSYVARIDFGIETDTLDAEGAVTATAEVNDSLFEPDAAARILESMLGSSMQVPPAFSAIKKDGRVAHRVARAGGEIELDARPIEVHTARPLAVDPATRSWTVEFVVSKGTYIRALARDIGIAAGTVAHLGALRRTASGPLSVDGACRLESLADAASVSSAFADPVAALGITQCRATSADVDHGRLIANDGVHNGTLVAMTDGRALKALYRAEGQVLRPVVVLPLPAAGGCA